MFFVFRCYLLPLGAMTLYVLNVPKRPCKITTFPQTRKGMEEIQLQCIGIGCLFLHELPLMYHELSLIVCFTRISINVPGIVINCFGLLHQGADGSSSHVMPTFACALAGIFCYTQEFRSASQPAKNPIAPTGLGYRTIHLHDNGQHPLPLPSWRTRIRHLLRPWDSPLSSLRVIARRNDEAIHLCQIHVRFNYVECKAFASKKRETHTFHFQLLIRQQTTTNDYSRLQTFVQRLSLDRHCIFATQLQKHRKWKSYNKERLGPSTPNSRANRKKP